MCNPVVAEFVLDEIFLFAASDCVFLHIRGRERLTGVSIPRVPQTAVRAPLWDIRPDRGMIREH